MTFTLIETKTLGTAAASIEFTSIPQTFTDLVLLVSARSDRTSVVGDGLLVSFNGLTADFSARVLRGNGTDTASFSLARFFGRVPTTPVTADTFSNIATYIPNYTSSTNKSYSVDSVFENNATASFHEIIAGLFSQTAAITSLTLSLASGPNFVAGSTVSLYGILKGSDGIVTTS